MRADSGMDLFGWRRRRAEIEAAIRAAGAPQGGDRSSPVDREFSVLLEKTRALGSREFPARADARRAWLNAGRAQRTPWIGYAVASAACLVLAIAGTAAWRERIPQYQADLVASAREQASLALPDGSVLRLNVGSRAEVRYFAARREVTLQAGEAFFEVAADRERPFEVAAAEVRVRVTGTRFDVRLLDDAVQVSVMDGEVQVVDGGSRRLLAALRAGRSVQVADGRIRRSEEIPPDHVGAWKDGVLALHRTPLAEMAKEVERYHPEQRVRIDPDVAALQVSGAFRISDLGGLLEGLRLALPVEVAQSEGAIRISRSREPDVAATLIPARPVQP